jgi:protocatechuate 3,4-dioxygenase beta subunit
MRTVARRVRVLLVVVLSATAGLAAQVAGPPIPSEPAKGTGLLIGQVVDATSARPIPGAMVVLTGGPSMTAVLPSGEFATAPGTTPTTPSAPRQVLTNADGRFLFRELARGRYTLRVTAPGYLAGGVGQTRAGGIMQAVELTSDDEKKGDVVAKLWKSATISGTITDEIGEPVAGLSIRLLRRTMVGGLPRFTSAPTTSSSATDDRGMYRISGLQPGEYLAAIWTTQTTLPISTTEAYLQIMASGGNTATTDLYRELNSSGAPFPSMGGYRVGDLVVQSTGGRGIGGSGPPLPIDENRFLAYPTQYYPASSTAAHATVITLGSGDDRSGIDMQLKLAPTIKVSGSVTGPYGPVPNVGVKLVPVEAEAFLSDSNAETALTATDAAGNFTLLGVTPGQYTLKVLRVPRPVTNPLSSMMTMIEVTGPNGMMMGVGTSVGAPNAPPPPLPPDPTLWANLPVVAGESDIAGLAVTLKPGPRLSGRIEFDGAGEKPAGDQIQRVQLSFSPIGGASSVQTSSAAKRVERDGRFSTVGYPPGRYLVSASLPVTTTAGRSVTWTFRNATLGGRDVSNEGLDVSGEDIADLVINFTDQTTELTGQVMDAKGQPDKDALVVVFPADTDSWKRGVMNARRMRTTRAATTGNFQLANLPPGAYYVAALPDATTPGEWQDPKILERLAGVAVRLTLADGEKKSQSLTTQSLR